MVWTAPEQGEGPPSPGPLPETGIDVTGLLRGPGKPRVDGIYLHIPFCFHKCHYCDFYSIVDAQDRRQVFLTRVLEEAHAWAGRVRGPVRTIFAGGGTPTLLDVEAWPRLRAVLEEVFDLSALEEFTVEANPETVTPEVARALVGVGVNRVSLGAQSFNERHLKTLERWHDPANVARAMGHFRDAGVENLNLDLIFAIPGQSLDDWRMDLQRALDLRPGHMSCYALTFEPNTPLAVKLQQGVVTAPDQELVAQMYEMTCQVLTEAGFEHYEISNFARPGVRCIHNLIYWEGENWLGLGPSASSHLEGWRWKNVPHLGRYLASAGAPSIQDQERLEPSESLGEQLMLRLRLVEGVDHAWLGPRLDDRRRKAISHHIARGLLEETSTHLRLTVQGLLLADTVLVDLL